jgi:ubiquinone/menaquinone biosynthesis C-methylase UbiE
MSEGPPLLDLPLADGPELSGDGLKSCCADVYAHPAVRWLLGGELHPGGAATTLRALELIDAVPGDRLLDVASGNGASAILAAQELGCEVVGVDYGARAVEGANEAAVREAPAAAIEFVRGDAESLPFADGSFDALLCECSLCTFPDKPAALAEFRRVLRPGGRVAICDVTADRGRIPAELSGAIATVACVGQALPSEGYLRLIREAGLEPYASERCDAEADALAERVQERLRGARLLGVDSFGLEIDDAIALVRRAREAIATGALGYSILAARVPADSPDSAARA